MKVDMEQNLPELRDIHLPDGVSIFPPAYGWWVILVSIIAIFIIINLVKYIRRKSKKLYAMRLIKQVHNQNIVASALQMSEILRRICVYKYKSAATLFGKEWIEFLNQHTKHKLEGKAADLLIDAPYIAQDTKNYNPDDVMVLQNFCKNWIGENL